MVVNLDNGINNLESFAFIELVERQTPSTVGWLKRLDAKSKIVVEIEMGWKVEWMPNFFYIILTC